MFMFYEAIEDNLLPSSPSIFPSLRRYIEIVSKTQIAPAGVWGEKGWRAYRKPLLRISRYTSEMDIYLEIDIFSGEILQHSSEVDI